TFSRSRGARPPGFMDYVNGALKVSSLKADRRTFWRKSFEGMRILRNKCSHFDTTLSEFEKTVLKDAGLARHVGSDERVQIQWSDYTLLAQEALEFVRELEAA